MKKIDNTDQQREEDDERADDSDEQKADSYVGVQLSWSGRNNPIIFGSTTFGNGTGEICTVRGSTYYFRYDNGDDKFTISKRTKSGKHESKSENKYSVDPHNDIKVFIFKILRINQ